MLLPDMAVTLAFMPNFVNIIIQ